MHIADASVMKQSLNARRYWQILRRELLYHELKIEMSLVINLESYHFKFQIRCRNQCFFTRLHMQATLVYILCILNISF